MMKYDVCIVGHGEFPDGVKSAIDVLVGNNDDVTCFNLNGQMTHAQFTTYMKEYLTQHPQALVFADMTGGAPYQLAAEIILESQHPNQYIVSSISMNAILDLYLKNSMDQLNPDNIEANFSHVLQESRKLMKVTPDMQEVAQEEVILEDGI